MSFEPSDSGLRPGIAADCRRALAGLRLDKLDSEGAVDLSAADAASRDHVAGCAFCSDRVAAVPRLAAFTAQRPVAPAALAPRSSGFLDAIYQRASEEIERGALGQWIEEAQVAPADEIGSWEDTIAERASRTIESAIETTLLQSPPPQPDDEAWSGVRRSILAGVASDRVKLRKPRRWWLGFLSAAAIIVLGLLISEGSSGQQIEGQPVIVFADLDRAPDVDFAIVRYGTRR